MQATNKEFISTYAKERFNPAFAKPHNIKIIDIAHALAYVCRGNGHLRTFYSVAQHCINCAKEAKARDHSVKVQFACLMHDASEAYLSDITRPLKLRLQNYIDIERELQATILEAVGIEELTPEEKKQIKDIDDAMLYYEFLELHGDRLFEEEPELLTDADFEEHYFTVMEEEFLHLFDQLHSQMISD